MSEPSFPALLAAAAAAALGVGVLKASVGGGIGLVLTPALGLVLPVPVAVALLAPLLNLSDPLTLGLYWRQWDARQLRVLLPTVLAGVVLGIGLLALLSEFWLKKTIGVSVLAFVGAQLALRPRARTLFAGPPGAAVSAAFGLTAGVASSVAHSGGIVLGPYLIGLGLGNAAVVATANAIVAVTNVVKLGGYWAIGFLTGRILLAAVAALPLLALGTWLGWRVNRWLPRRWFEAALLALAVAGALRLLTG